MTPRPTQTQETFARATLETAHEMVEVTPGLVREGETREEADRRIAEAIAALRHELRFGGAHAGRLLGQRLGFDPNPLIEELLDYVSTREANIVARDIREWVKARRLVPPFGEKAAKVKLSAVASREIRQDAQASGVAIRRPDLDLSGYVRFVPDAAREEYVGSKALRGYRIVRWEDMVDIVAVTEPEDVAVVDAAFRRERTLEDRSTAVAGSAGSAPGRR